MIMENKVFRQKSVDRVASPEQLNDYVKVATPGVWMLLISVILLLLGVCVWGVWGRLDSAVQAAAECRNGVMTCYISESDAEKVAVGMKAAVNGQEFTITDISQEAQELSGDTDSRILHAGSFAAGDWICTAEADTDLADGVYEAVITVESISPMSFILN